MCFFYSPTFFCSPLFFIFLFSSLSRNLECAQIYRTGEEKKKKCQDTRRDVQKRSAWLRGKRFSYRASPVYKNNPKNLRIAPRWPSLLLHIIQTLSFHFSTLEKKKKKEKIIRSSSFFPLWITHPSPLSLLLKSLFVHSSPCHLLSYSAPSLILTHKLACLATCSPRNFSFFPLTMWVCQPFALTIKIPPVPVISCAWQPARGSVFVEICRSSFFFFFWRPCLHRQTLGKCDQGAMYTGKNGEGDGWEKKKGVEITRDAFLCTFVIQTGRDVRGEEWIFFYKGNCRKNAPYLHLILRQGQKLVTRCTWERKAF